MGAHGLVAIEVAIVDIIRQHRPREEIANEASELPLRRPEFVHVQGCRPRFDGRSEAEGSVLRLLRFCAPRAETLFRVSSFEHLGDSYA